MGVRVTCLDPRSEDVPYLPVVTVGAKFRGRGVITCAEFYEPYTHYVGGRTLPCLTPICQACLMERPSRYEGFVSVVWIANRKHEIVRITKPAMIQLKLALSGSGSPRGRILQLERKGDKKTGRLACGVEPEQIEVSRLPQAPNLEAHLARIWRVDGMEVTSDERAYIAQLSAFVETSIEKGSSNHAEA